MVADAHWWLVRVASTRSTRTPWSDRLATTVRTAMATANEERHLVRLATDLRRRWPVTVYDERVAELPPP